jgi:hypothetical protein
MLTLRAKYEALRAKHEGLRQHFEGERQHFPKVGDPLGTRAPRFEVGPSTRILENVYEVSGREEFFERIVGEP